MAPVFSRVYQSRELALLCISRVRRMIQRSTVLKFLRFVVSALFSGFSSTRYINRAFHGFLSLSFKL